MACWLLGFFVDRIAQDLPDRFQQNLVGGCGVGQERFHYILMMQIEMKGWDQTFVSFSLTL